ncbi:hypothetical protein K438DRAFT_1987416 [Mycena galopus ATCC 62051]|nr:hypothetical protein K438DRAFT_1987416 [Mycena galopus ATCC 62051]
MIYKDMKLMMDEMGDYEAVTVVNSVQEMWAAISSGRVLSTGRKGKDGHGDTASSGGAAPAVGGGGTGEGATAAAAASGGAAAPTSGSGGAGKGAPASGGGGAAAPALGGGGTGEASGGAAAPASGGGGTAAPALGGGGAGEVSGGAAAPASDSGAAPAASGGAAAPASGEDDDGDWVDEDTLNGLPTTHRSRNPTAALVQFRVQKKKPVGPNVRATQRKKLESKSKRNRALAMDLLKLHREEEAQVEVLSKTHDINIKEVRHRMKAGSKYSQPRKTSSYNALVSLVMKDLNEDRVISSKYRMKEVKAMMKSDPTLKEPYTEEEINDMREALDKKKALRSVGVRGSNQAVAADAKWTIDSLTREITDMATRNNMIGFGMFVKGDLHDTHVPAAIESLGALKFFAEVFHKTPADVLVLFEMWSVTQKRGGLLPFTLAEWQKPCGEKIRTELITGKPNIAMNFKRYIQVIVQRWGVGLLTWPYGVDFKRMSRQTTIGNLQKLYNDLMDGSCKWVKLSKKQQQEIEEEFEEMVRSGKRVEKVRQQRSDKGQSHVKKKRVYLRGEDSGSDEEDEHDSDGSKDGDEPAPAPAKKTGPSKKPTPAKQAPKQPSAKSSKVSKSKSGGTRSSGSGPKRKRPEEDEEERPRKRRRSNDNREKKRKSEGDRDDNEERPKKKKKKGAELKRLQKQMEKGREKSKELEQARPKPRSIVKGRKGAPPGIRES